jgi:hypothetical protein
VPFGHLFFPGITVGRVFKSGGNGCTGKNTCGGHPKRQDRDGTWKEGFAETGHAVRRMCSLCVNKDVNAEAGDCAVVFRFDWLC